ncbi:periplasmic/membrane protein associated with [Arsukibacterium ikkense]|uniref:Periplasmic/membrane protein associated with n=1 Tax=Arsukibacterium ikkense TaxID=336831 RepID=A0A0M2V462_9GAMM|nr:DUF2489 domain-containing protein [Arsukibacterium ikkense]KKO45189.1 periplasmic/membrane protein associated with [Arsukibacterium ikkense]
MHNSWMIVLLLIALLLIAGLAFYAGKLLWLVRQQQQQQLQQVKQQQHQQLQNQLYVEQSIYTICKAVDAGQCELSEGALRVWVLLNRLPEQQQGPLAADYPGIFQMYQILKDMPTHQARQAQTKQAIRQQDSQRLQAEQQLKPQILADTVKLLQRFKPAEAL